MPVHYGQHAYSLDFHLFISYNRKERFSHLALEHEKYDLERHEYKRKDQIVRQYQEKSADERERDLWIASEQFMRGKLTIEQLEEIEQPYINNIKEACLALAEPTEPVESHHSFFGRLFRF